MQYKKMISDIRDVLINDWDPINIGTNPNLKNEYDGYIGSIIKMLSSDVSIDRMIISLQEIERDSFGINNSNLKILYDVACKLKYIGDKYKTELFK